MSTQEDRTLWWRTLSYVKKERLGKVEEARETLYYQIISRFNDEERYYGGYFDCGELGILRIFWRKSAWERCWVEIEPLPEGIEIR